MMNMEVFEIAGKIRSIEKAFKILELFNHNRYELSVAEVNNYTGFPKSTIHGIISTLMDLGYIRQDSRTKKYRLGHGVFQLVSNHDETNNILKAAKPFLLELATKFEETVHLAKLDNGEVYYIDKVQVSNRLTICSEIGRKLPAYCTSIGKALLAFQPVEEIQNFLEKVSLKSYTSNTITDPGELFEELKKIRARGVAFDNEEIEEGLACLGVPVRGLNGEVVAAISIAGPSNRIKIKEANLIKGLQETAKKISVHL